jgi:hypothetical protein
MGEPAVGPRMTLPMQLVLRVLLEFPDPGSATGWS